MDIVKMWLWIGITCILSIICIGWVLVAHRRLGKPLPKSMKLGMISSIIASVIIVSLAIVASLN